MTEYLEKWRKVEPAFDYGWFKDICKEEEWCKWIGIHGINTK